MKVWELQVGKFYIREKSENLYYIDNENNLCFICEDNNYKGVKLIVLYNEVKNWVFREAPNKPNILEEWYKEVE